jgi:hypothetical protein
MFLQLTLTMDMTVMATVVVPTPKKTVITGTENTANHAFVKSYALALKRLAAKKNIARLSG